MKVIIDRFEGEYAVCEKEDGSTFDLQKDKLPGGCKEGDTLNIDNEHIEIDVSETNKRKEKIKKLMDNLFE